MKILVFGPIKDKSRIYGYSNSNIDHCDTVSFTEIPFQIYNFKGFLKLILYPFIFLLSVIYYCFYIYFYFKSRYKFIVIAPESPGLILVAKFVSFFLKKRIPLVYIDYYWSPYLTNLDRKTDTFYSKVSIFISFQLEKLIFKFSDKILQSVSDEAEFLDNNFFSNIYKDKILNIPYPCFLKEYSSAEVSTDNKIQKNKIYFWGSGAPLQGIEVIIEVMNLLSIGGYKCVFCAPKVIMQKNVLNEKIEIHYFEDKDEQDVLDFYEQMKKDAVLTFGIFGESIKANHVFPNKIIESLCLGIPCITKKSDFIERTCVSINNEISSKIIFVEKDPDLIYNEIKLKFNELNSDLLSDQFPDTNYFSKENFQVKLFDL